MNLDTPIRAIERAGRFFLEELWAAGAGSASRFQRLVVQSVRIAFITIEGFFRDKCSLRASALTFVSMMALVPTLALMFAILRGLGWHGARLEELILGRATMLSSEAISTIVSYIDNTSFAGLGVLGGTILFLTVVSVMTNIESSLNAIWGNVRNRTPMRRVTDYFGVIVIAPVLLALATSLTAAVQSNSMVQWMRSTWGLSAAVSGVLHLFSYASVWGLFTFIYLFVPNTRVGLFPATVAGVFAGSLWHVTQFAYIRFQIGMANYNAIYGAMAQLPLLMAWVYISWVIVLLGAEISVAVQTQGSYSRERRRGRERGQALREHIGLNVACALALVSEGRLEAPSVEDLAAESDVPARTIREILEEYRDAGIVHLSDDSPERCFLSLAPDKLPLSRLLDVLRGGVPDRFAQHGDDMDARVLELLTRAAVGRNEALGELTLRDLATSIQG